MVFIEGNARLTDTFTHKWSKRPRPLANITATQRFVFYHVYKSQKAILHHNAVRDRGEKETVI